MNKKITIQIPTDWRKGQFIFNFLEWLKNNKAVRSNQSSRLADSFHLPDEDFDKFMAEFTEKLKLEDKEWEKTFKSFYNDNESGGSSRWLVSPNTIKQFIKELLR